MVPESEKSRGIFIIYALMGLPVAIITLKYTGILLSKLIRHLITKIEKRYFGRSQPARLNLKCFIVSLTVFIVDHLVMANFYARHANISFVSSIYAVFVTMTTIGFGDFNVGLFTDDDPKELLPILVISRIPVVLFTLTVVSCIINTPAEVHEYCTNATAVQPNSMQLDEENQEKTHEVGHSSGGVQS